MNFNIVFDYFLVLCFLVLSNYFLSMIKSYLLKTKKMKDIVYSYPKTFSIDPFFTSVFKPECCPNTYSSSFGIFR